MMTEKRSKELLRDRLSKTEDTITKTVQINFF